MDDEQILEKAIEKAEKNGWKEGKNQLLYQKNYGGKLPLILIYSHDFAKAFWGEEGYPIKVDDLKHEWYLKETRHGTVDTKVYGCKVGCCDVVKINNIVYYHDENDFETEQPWNISLIMSEHKIKYNQGWQYHLQQMVLETEPIKYLGRFI